MSNREFFDEIGIDQGNDPILSEIRRDLEGKRSPLELISDYLGKIKGTFSNDPPAFAKLAKLFERGRAPEKVEGHLFGVTIGLRTGILSGNILSLLWGRLLADAPPWVGKGFTPMDAAAIKEYQANEKSERPVFLGINFFRKNNLSLFNRLSIPILISFLGIKDEEEKAKDRYGYDMRGGPFIGRKDKSVNPDSEQKDVFQINYRFPSLKNRFPLKYLIDEIVEVAPGLYLGQLLFATRCLLKEYDPSVPTHLYKYAHFGYFSLMDEKWNEERRRLFPYTEDTFRTKASSIEWGRIPKYTSFTFTQTIDGRHSEELLKEVIKDMEGKETILDLLKSYSDKLKEDMDTNSHYFLRLEEIFNRGVPPLEVRGYYHGAVVAFRNEGYIKTFNINTLNLAWPLARHFSPWTGKTFEDIEKERLKNLTDDFEKGEIPTFWGTNTYSARTTKQKAVVEAMRLARIETQEASSEEILERGYDLKSFFFIAKVGISVNSENNGKTVFQFNYRWPRLKTFPPDHYCIDEIVQIAEGLYLGQLVYATALLEKYNPNSPSSIYNYRNFGYFLLMDDEWYLRKIKIGFAITTLEK